MMLVQLSFILFLSTVTKCQVERLDRPVSGANDAEMDISDEQYNFLNGTDDGSSESFWPNDTLFQWIDGIIPYQFDPNATFDANYKERIIKVIHHLNSELSGCIFIRYVYFRPSSCKLIMANLQQS